MRTDSPSLSKEAQDKVRDFIAHKIGSDYLSKEPKVYKAHAKAQEAHEAIRPTNFNLSPDKVKPFLDQSQIKLYELIFWRTIASQMKEAEFRENLVYLDVEIKAKKYIFLAKGLKDVFLSFIKFYPYHLSLNLLPELTEGVFIRPEKIEILSLKTKPKPRYTEASLIKTLEKLGIGRPSTYAPIIDILFQRNYLQRQGRYLFPTEIGEKVIEFLKAHFNHLIDYGFTADMEEKLDQIAEGKRKWVNIVSDFYTPLAKLIAKKDSEIDRTKVIEKEYIDKKCPKCQGRLAIRFGRFGNFISCDNFPKCSYKEALSKNNNIEAELDSKTKEALARVREKFPFCPKCKGQLVLRKSKFGFFLGCKNYPRCRFIAPLSTKPEFKNKKY